MIKLSFTPASAGYFSLPLTFYFNASNPAQGYITDSSGIQSTLTRLR